MQDCPIVRGVIGYPPTVEPTADEWKLDLTTLQAESILGFTGEMSVSEIHQEIMARAASWPRIQCPYVR